MKLRFIQTLAGPSGWYPLGLVIEIATLTEEHQRWIAAGIVSVVRDPDAALETPEGPDTHERAGVPVLCPGGTAICLGGGPSLTPADVDACRGQGLVIAINDAYKLAPWADVLYACDEKWWRWHAGVPSFAGLKFALQPWRAERRPDVTVLENTGIQGFERKPTALRNGKNSGYQALHLAVHAGARRVLLLGYDMQRLRGASHWFGEHPDGITPPVESFLPYFAKLAPILATMGVTVINCSRQTALTCFPRLTLEEALAGREAVA